MVTLLAFNSFALLFTDGWLGKLILRILVQFK